MGPNSIAAVAKDAHVAAATVMMGDADTDMRPDLKRDCCRCCSRTEEAYHLLLQDAFASQMARHGMEVEGMVMWMHTEKRESRAVG